MAPHIDRCVGCGSYQKNLYRRNVSSPEEIWDIVQDFDEPALCGSKLAAAGLEIGDYINTGSEGAVYHSGPGRVIKFTINPEEARIAVYLRKHWHPGFPRIYNVVDIADFCRVEPPLYAIVKEDIDDTDRDQIKRHLIYLGNILLDKAASSEYASLSDIQRAIEDATDRFSEIEEVMVDAGQKNRIPWLRKQFFRLKKLVRWLNDVKLYAGDMGGANWGFRDGTTIVVRDFGGFSFSRKKQTLDVPKLRR